MSYANKEAFLYPFLVPGSSQRYAYYLYTKQSHVDSFFPHSDATFFNFLQIKNNKQYNSNQYFLYEISFTA